MGEDYLGRGGRLASGPAPELVAAGFAAEVADGVRLARGLSLSDLAHAVALAEGGAIAGEAARAHAYPALRDAERLRRAHGWLDLSVAGAGGSAGSRWPLDRDRLAELLGCAGVVPHARDAMWQADGYVELAAAVAMGATHRAQLAQDLEIFASAEFGFVSLAEGHSRASALMPQKRNPYALAVVRAAAAAAAGELAGLLVAL